MAKTENKPAENKSNLEKKFNLKLRSKYNKYIFISLAAVAISGVYHTTKNTTSNNSETPGTQINTPIISRTELTKKPNIDIQLYDAEQSQIEQTANVDNNKKSAMAEELKNVDNTAKVKSNTTSASKSEAINSQDAIIKTITKLELNQQELAKEMLEINKESTAKKLAEVNAKLTKIESLNGNLGNLSKIFLGQQLVMLDNAFKVGGNQNLAINNIHNFAKNVAKNNEVAKKLEELLNLTNESAIITPSALNFYAQNLKDIKINSLKMQKEEVADNASFIAKIKAFLKEFIIVKKQDKISEEQLLWNTSIKQIQKSIIFGEFAKVETLLENKELQELGNQDFKNFAELFNTYLKQQQAMQAVLGAFIEGYSYDY